MIFGKVFNRYNMMKYGPTVGTVVASLGVIATGILSARAMYRYMRKLEEPCDVKVEALKEAALPAAVAAATISTFALVRTADKKVIAGLSAAVAAASSQVSDITNTVYEELPPEKAEELMAKVDAKRGMADDKDVIVLDPDGALYFEPYTGIKIRAYSETIKDGFYKLNRNYQLRAGLASLYELFCMMGVKQKEISDRKLEWTKYIGWYCMWLSEDGFSFIDWHSAEEVSEDMNGKYHAIVFDTPLMPICADPPDVVHMICHTEDKDLTELEYDKDDVDTEISMEIGDSYIE